MSSVWTPLVWKVERTCRIGVGIKAASHRQVLGEQLLAPAKALQRRQVEPLLPFVGQLLVGHLAHYAKTSAPDNLQVPRWQAVLGDRFSKHGAELGLLEAVGFRDLGEVPRPVL